MTQASSRFQSFEEYLSYDDGTDQRYELVAGELVKLPNESTLNTQIAVFLIAAFLQLNLPYHRLGIKQQISVSSSEVTAREPDLIVHSEDSALALGGRKQALLTFDMPAPVLVIEVVSPGSPGDKNYDRDYVEKPKEYAARGIPEYWLIDPSRSVVIMLYLDGKQYTEIGQFRDSDRIICPTFPELRLMAEQVLRAGQ